jgi:uncharacterized protein
MRILSQFLIGLLFGTGLVIAGMSDPAKVLNFLDIAAIVRGGWDASLAFVMGGGVIAAFLGYRLAFSLRKPVLAGRFHLPLRSGIDARLLAGAGIFGIGWGLAGFCPGPAFTALANGSVGPYLFIGAMLAGMAAAGQTGRWQFNTPQPAEG